MSDAERTKEQLLAELDALRRRVESLEGTAKTTPDAELAPPHSGVEFTKRDVLKIMWVAPVLLKVALPNAVFAQGSPDPGPPSPSPSPSPSPPPFPSPSPSPPP